MPFNLLNCNTVLEPLVNIQRKKKTRISISYHVPTSKTHYVTNLCVLLDASSGHVVPEGHHSTNGRPAMFTHPLARARAIRHDGDVTGDVISVMGRALVRVGKLIGAHDTGEAVVVGQGECLEITQDCSAAGVTVFHSIHNF